MGVTTLTPQLYAFQTYTQYVAEQRQPATRPVHVEAVVMSLLRRLSFTVRAWLNALLERHADPVAELDYSYEKLRDELQNVNSAIAEVATQRKRLEIHRRRLRETTTHHDEQVRQAIQQDRDDLARRALKKKHTVTEQLANLDEQIDRLQATQDELIERQLSLRGEIEGFRVHKEVLKARHGAAQASTRAAEAFTGVGGEMADVNRAIERATERTEQMEARAAALEELEETGALDSILSEGDDIDRELERRSTEQRVEMELESVRRELGQESEGEVEEATS